MSSDFDPYRVWLSIPVSEQPANYYRLLGVELFESDDEVISNAADRQMSHVRTFQSGQFSELSQKILNELSAARVTLLNKKKKSKYDANLRSKLSASSEVKVDDTRVVELPPPPSFTPSQPEVQPKIEVKTVNTKDVVRALTPYIVILLSALVFELLFLLVFFRYYHNKQHHPVANFIIAKAEGLYNQSIELENEKNYSEALIKMNAISELVPEVEKYKTRKRQLEKLENEKKARGLYYQLIELEANQKYEEALSLINQVCELAPGNKDYESARQRINVLSKENKVGFRKTFTVNGVEFAFRYCLPGTFEMGSSESEPGRIDNESKHQVTLTRGFWMMETEVTQKQWKAVMGTNPSEFKGDNLPVESVSWNDCQEFCNKCTELGLPVQLPTEAQWEYACRAGSTTAYFWGNALNGDKANCDGYYPCGTAVKGEFIKKTAPVGSYAPNAWGLYDMHGNVREWCQDCLTNYPNGRVIDWIGPLNGSCRVNRGGGWDSGAGSCRSARREYGAPELQDVTIGFRCIRGRDNVIFYSLEEQNVIEEEKKTKDETGDPFGIEWDEDDNSIIDDDDPFL